LTTTDDPFSLFGLPARYTQDAAQLERIWKTLAARVHPDRYATASATEQRLAMQWAARVNDAWRVLRAPLLRARYLCERAGVDVAGETNTAMTPEFLMQQIAWRERLDEVRGDPTGLAGLAGELQAAQVQAEVRRLLDDEADPKAAALRVREWMFLDKLAQEVAEEVAKELATTAPALAETQALAAPP